MLQITHLPFQLIAGFGVDRSLGQWRGVFLKKSGEVKLSQQTEADLYSESIDLLFFTNNDPNQVEDLLRRLENAESDWNVVADSAPRWQMGGKAGMFRSQFHFEKTWTELK